MAQPTSDRMSYLEPIKQSSLEIKDAIAQLSQIFPNEAINSRLVDWLWHYVRNNVPNNTLQLVNYHTPQGVIELSKQLSADKQLDHSAIRTKKNEMMASERAITWLINEDSQLRLINWINQNELYTHLDTPGLTDTTGSTKNIEEVIAYIDRCNLSIEEKNKSLQQLNQMWEDKKSNDYLFKWFKDNDTLSKLSTAYNWICENSDIFKKKSRIPIFLFTPPPSQFNNIEDLFIYFDQPAFTSTDIAFCIDRIKRRFNQAKYRESIKDKKQCNLILKNNTIEMLGKIAKKTGKRRADIIEYLIEEHYKKIISDAKNKEV